VVILYALNEGYLDEIEVKDLSAYQTSLGDFLQTQEKKTLAAIAKEKDLTPKVIALLQTALKKHQQLFKAVNS
jgi:F0F1-type ATP synthase alpha subunit